MELTKQDLERISDWFTYLQIRIPELIDEKDKELAAKIDVMKFKEG